MMCRKCMLCLDFFFFQETEDNVSVDERFGYWEKAGKMVVIEALLKMWNKQEHRVLIFTQSRQVKYFALAKLL